MAKSVKLKDRNNNQILPITRATTVEMNDGTNMQEKLDSIEDNILEVNYDSGNTALVFGSSVKYTITITGSPTSILSNISVNGELKTVSNFPLEVYKGSSLYFVNVSAAYSVSVTMDGKLITTVDGGDDFQLANITEDVVLNIYNGSSSN